MTLKRDGFLSDSIAAVAEEAWRRYCPRHVALVERANRFAIIVSATPRDLQRRDADLFAALFLARAIQDFQAAVLLGRWGLRAQSRAMVRSTFETALFCVAASQDLVLNKGARKKPKKGDPPITRFVDAFESGHQRFRRQIAHDLQEVADLPSDQEAMLSALLRELGPLGGEQDVDVRGLAEDLGLAALYTSIYRPLSQDAHPSATSLEHHVTLSPERKIAGLRSGPDYLQFEDTLALAVCSLLVALEGFLERFGTPDEAQEKSAIVEAYRRLLEDSNGIE